MAWRSLHRIAVAGALCLVVGLLVIAFAPGILRPASADARAFARRLTAAPWSVLEWSRATPRPVATPTALIVLAPIPSVVPSPSVPTVAPTPSPLPPRPSIVPTSTPFPTRPPADPTAVPTPRPTPTITLEEFWARLRQLEYHSVLDQLPVLPPGRRDDPLFGINDALSAEDATAPIMHGLGASLDRVEIRWDEIEPSPGEFRFDRLDGLVQNAERWHISVLAVVDGAPAWAVDGKERVGAGPPKGLDKPALLPGGKANPENPWAFFLWTVSKRYGSRIAAWEIWNEPNFRDYWRGTPEDYALLFQIGRQVLHQTSPKAPVLIGGMVEDDGGFLRTVVQRLCPTAPCPSPPFDGVAWHIYGNPGDLLGIVDQTRSTLGPYRVQPTIWVTEANVAVDDPQTPGALITGPDEVSLEQQAAFVLQLYALARAVDVRTVAIYRAEDVDEGRYWGLLRANLTARPALFAYRTAADWISHAQFVKLSHPAPEVTRVELRRPGQSISVIWTDSTTPVQIEVPTASSTGTLVQFTGAATEIHASQQTFRISLPVAPPRRPATAPLALPVILVTAT
jgi:hypothetical protein